MQTGWYVSLSTMTPIKNPLKSLCFLCFYAGTALSARTVNDINVIRPLESIETIYDQSTGKQMVAKANSDVKSTFASDAKQFKETGKFDGIHYTLSVGMLSAGHDNKWLDLFKETEWYKKIEKNQASALTGVFNPNECL